MEIDMNSKLLRALSACVLMTVAVASNAQSNDTQMASSSAPAMTPSKKPTQADRALAKAVRRALGKAPGFDVSGVFVRARSGAVTLSGTVRSGDQIQQAEQVARSVQGVNSVSNKLTLFHGGNG
jgi:hyperosmotically inducible periplasmic protein